jgi:hypothetical protein
LGLQHITLKLTKLQLMGVNTIATNVIRTHFAATNAFKTDVLEDFLNVVLTKVVAPIQLSAAF